MDVVPFPIIVLGVVFLYALPSQHVEATVCTFVTHFTCPVTHFSNGTCLGDGNCACRDGYSPGVYGCQKDLIKPHIRMTDQEAAPVGTGIFALLSLTCEPAQSDVIYTWKRDGTVIRETGATVTHNEMRRAPVELFRYSCEYSVDGRVSPESDAFELQVFARIEDIDTDIDMFKPIVRGIPTTIVEGVELTLTCANYIFHQVQRVEWSLPNGDFNGMEMDLKITKGMDDSDVSCTIVYSLDFPITSTEVRIPKISEDIPNVVIKEGDRFVEAGQNFNLSCNFVEEDFVTRGVAITWGWSFEGVPKSSLTTQSITIQTARYEFHDGQWQCCAQYASNAKKESPPIHVNVDLPITITAKPTPARAIKDGIMEIQCDVETSSAANFSYGWTLNQVNLFGYHDDTIFVNFADDTSVTRSGDYICRVSVDQRTAASNTVSVLPPIEFRETPAPTLQIKGNPQVFLYGDTYQLECLYSADYTVPGVEFEYYQDGVLLANSTFTMNDTSSKIFTCGAVFNNLEKTSSNGIKVLLKGGPDTTLRSSSPSPANATSESTENQSVKQTQSQSTKIIVSNSTSTPSSFVPIETTDNDIDNIPIAQESTTTSVSQDSMSSPTWSNTMDPDTESESIKSSSATTLKIGAGRESVSVSDGQQPTLIVIGHSTNSSFNFNETYHLKCELHNKDGHGRIKYEFLQGGITLTTSESDVYTITNDVFNKVYTCRALSANMSSPTSNPVAVSFNVLDKVHITGKESHVTTCSAEVTLECDASLLPRVPDQVTYTWYNQEMDIIDKSPTLTITVTQGFLSSFHCKAEVGSHFKMASLTIAVTGTDEHCSACSPAMSRILLLIAAMLTLTLH